MPTIKKKSKKKDYIVVEKYMRNILGLDTRLYKINLNQGFHCNKKLTLKKKVNPLTKKIKNNPLIYDILTHHKKISTKTLKKDTKITEHLI